MKNRNIFYKWGITLIDDVSNKRFHKLMSKLFPKLWMLDVSLCKWKTGKFSEYYDGDHHVLYLGFITIYLYN